MYDDSLVLTLQLTLINWTPHCTSSSVSVICGPVDTHNLDIGHGYQATGSCGIHRLANPAREAQLKPPRAAHLLQALPSSTVSIWHEQAYCCRECGHTRHLCLLPKDDGEQQQSPSKRGTACIVCSACVWSQHPGCVLQILKKVQQISSHRCGVP